MILSRVVSLSVVIDGAIPKTYREQNISDLGYVVLRNGPLAGALVIYRGDTSREIAHFAAGKWTFFEVEREEYEVPDPEPVAEEQVPEPETVDVTTWGDKEPVLIPIHTPQPIVSPSEAQTTEMPRIPIAPPEKQPVARTVSTGDPDLDRVLGDRAGGPPVTPGTMSFRVNVSPPVQKPRRDQVQNPGETGFFGAVMVEDPPRFQRVEMQRGRRVDRRKQPKRTGLFSRSHR